MKKENYLNILQTNFPGFIDVSAYPQDEVLFQQDGNPKHTAKIVKDCLKIAQSPDPTPIENL